MSAWQANPAHAVIKKPICVSAPPQPCWTQEELPNRGPHLVGDLSHGEARAEWRRRKKRRVTGFPYTEQEEVSTRGPALISSDDKGKKQVNGGSALEFEGLLKACVKKKDLHSGRRLHADIVREGLLDMDGFLENILINLYAKCGVLDKALSIFEGLAIHDTVSWTVLIAGYSQHGYGEEALTCFQHMQHEGISPDTLTFTCILKACCCVYAANKGQDIHALIAKDCLSKENVMLANALVDMYAKSGALERAQELFNELPFRDVVSWNALITGYALAGQGQEVLSWFEKMQAGGFSPSVPTFLCILKACGSIGATRKGQEIHSWLIKEGLLEENIMIGNALVSMYIKCRLLADAQYVCDKLPNRDIVTWNTLIAGYAQHGHGQEALHCLTIMQKQDGLSPNDVTLTSTLKACGMVRDAKKGQELFEQIVKRRLLEKNIIVANAAVDMFAKCGQLRKARQVFDKIVVKDVTSWNILMVGYGQQGQDEEVLSCFEQMRNAGFAPDAISFSCTLKACASVGAASRGQEVHGWIVGDGLLENCTIVGTALVDMYAKCGMLVEAQEVFHTLLAHDLVLWNALIAGYSQLGKDQSIFFLIDKLIEDGEEPDSITHTLVLSTCSHGGLVEKAQAYFEEASKAQNFLPSLEHYTCLIDLFGRAGHVSTAMMMIEEMFFPADCTVWMTLLGACQRWGKTKLGNWAFGHAEKSEDKDGVAYSYMGSIFAAAGEQEVYHLVEAF